MGTGGTIITTTTGGLVGIGVTNPSVNLQLSPTASISNVGSSTTLAGTVGSALTVAQFLYLNNNISYLRIKATRNAVGSDWQSASTKLVNVTDTTEQGYIEYNPNGSTNGIAFGRDTTEWARFLSGGNFGIGTTNAQTTLHVNGSRISHSLSGINTVEFGYAAGSGDTNAYGLYVPSGRNFYLYANNILRLSANSTGVGIGTTNPIQPFQVGFGSSIVVVDNMGDLGIGTTSPTSKLHVIGDVLVSGTSTLGTLQVSSGIVTASSGIVTYYGDGSKLTGIIASSGGSIGIQSGGIAVGTGITTVNFVGTGLTASQSTNTSNIYLPAPGVSLGLAIALGG